MTRAETKAGTEARSKIIKNALVVRVHSAKSRPPVLSLKLLEESF